MKRIEKPADDLRERFILWLASKPVGMEYDWKNSVKCACGSFIREELTHTERCWFIFNYTTVEDHAGRVWERWNHTAEFEPRTYGALLKRVREGD